MKPIILAVLFAIALVQPARAEENPEWFACASNIDCVEARGVCANPRAVNVQYLSAYQDAVAKEQAEANAPPPIILQNPRCARCVSTRNAKCQVINEPSRQENFR